MRAIWPTLSSLEASSRFARSTRSVAMNSVVVVPVSCRKSRLNLVVPICAMSASSPRRGGASMLARMWSATSTIARRSPSSTASEKRSSMASIRPITSFAIPAKSSSAALPCASVPPIASSRRGICGSHMPSPRIAPRHAERWANDSEHPLPNAFSKYPS